MLADLPHDERIRSRKVAAGVATLIVDATGLAAPDRNALEAESRRVSRFDRVGHTPGRVTAGEVEPNRLYPLTLDLRT